MSNITPKQIVALRQRLSLTQEQFAWKLGLTSREYICRLEKGHLKPTGPLLQLLRALYEREVVRAGPP